MDAMCWFVTWEDPRFWTERGRVASLFRDALTLHRAIKREPAYVLGSALYTDGEADVTENPRLMDMLDAEFRMETAINLDRLALEVAEHYGLTFRQVGGKSHLASDWMDRVPAELLTAAAA